jgi:hypothetical protein
MVPKTEIKTQRERERERETLILHQFACAASLEHKKWFAKSVHEKSLTLTRSSQRGNQHAITHLGIR